MRDVIESTLFWVATVVSVLTLVLLIVNMSLVSGNAGRQAEIARRAQVISDAVQRSRGTPLVRDLIIAAQKEPNEKVRALLTRYGIPIPQAGAAAGTEPAPAAAEPAPAAGK
jgi:hypothetical protein